MGNFIFEISGLNKKTRIYEKQIIKVLGTLRKANREMAAQIEKFDKTHENTYTAGPIDILDENFFKAIKTEISPLCS